MEEPDTKIPIANGLSLPMENLQEIPAGGDSKQEASDDYIQKGDKCSNGGDVDSGIDVNGCISKLSPVASPSRDEDQSMNHTHNQNQSGIVESVTPNEDTGAPLRRSARNRKTPASFDDTYVNATAQEAAKSTAASSRPKRKASSAAQKSFTSKEDLEFVNDTLCAPMVSEELRSYRGWVELESDPAFFQAMLHEVGAPDLKITELFSTDEESIDALPKPIYGLIFLFPYENQGEQGGEERHNCPDDLWFANQTNSNSCATVALLNIAMNIPKSQYGSELRRFKEETTALSSLDRGNAIDSNDFIRCIHNSVARRTQLLNEDLVWQNNRDEEEKQQRKRKRFTNPIRRSKAKSKAQSNASDSKASAGTNRNKKRPDPSNSTNHYIAYVPHDGKVWEFDGLEDKPLCLGSFPGNSDDWVMTAIETIQVRMAAGVFSNTFNLLALCSTPLQSLEDRLIQSLAGAQKLEQDYRTAEGEGDNDPTWPHPPIAKLFSAEKLQALNNLSWDMVANIGPTESFLSKISQADFAKEQAALLMAELLVEQNDLESELAAEVSSHHSARLEYESRQRDFAPFIHQFLLALAETGQLEETVNNFIE
jgi:ubiquitin carboxyl-terminal hydrolase L5